MPVARRDPPFHNDADDVAPVNLGVYPAAKASRGTRVVAAIQLESGRCWRFRVGIASAYSFYRANFSPKTTCQSLRSGIVAMLTKSVDAATPAHPRSPGFARRCRRLGRALGPDGDGGVQDAPRGRKDGGSRCGPVRGPESSNAAKR